MLQSRLIILMQRELESNRLQLSSYCVQQIEQLVTHGAERMRLGKVSDHPGRLMNAERNLRSLVKYLHDYSRNVGTFPELSNTDFDAALRTCPIFWPYSSSG